MSITFRWTVLLTATDGGETRVGLVHTRIRERQSGEVLTVETGPEKHGGRLRPNSTLEVAQQAGGFFSSSLYPGSWDAVTTVEVTYPSGRADRLDVPFAFQ